MNVRFVLLMVLFLSGLSGILLFIRQKTELEQVLFIGSVLAITTSLSLSLIGRFGVYEKERAGLMKHLDLEGIVFQASGYHMPGPIRLPLQLFGRWQRRRAVEIFLTDNGFTIRKKFPRVPPFEWSFPKSEVEYVDFKRKIFFFSSVVGILAIKKRGQKEESFSLFDHVSEWTKIEDFISTNKMGRPNSASARNKM